MNAYQTWWDNEGSAMRPLDHEDYEEFARRITAIAWSNAEKMEREACAKICESMPYRVDSARKATAAIRARGG